VRWLRSDYLRRSRYDKQVDAAEAGFAGTDGFGRSETDVVARFLRGHARFITVATLHELLRTGSWSASSGQALKELGSNADNRTVIS